MEYGLQMGGDLHEKRIAVKRAIVDLDPSSVSDDFEHWASDHAACERPCAPFDAGGDLDDQD